jgi:hypothetical protein
MYTHTHTHTHTHAQTHTDTHTHTHIEIIPEAVSTQKGTLYYICTNFKCNGNIFHININDYEGTYNVGDVLNCITEKGEVNYTIIEKYDNNIIVDEVTQL